MHCRCAGPTGDLSNRNCLQTDAAALKYLAALARGPGTIRYKWHVVSKHRDMYRLGTQQEQRQQKQQQLQPLQASENGVIIRTNAMLEYIKERQQEHKQQLQLQECHYSHLGNNGSVATQ